MAYNYRTGRSYRRGPNWWIIGGIVIALFVTLVALYTYKHDIVTSTVTIHVVDKQAVATGSNGHKYLIYTTGTTYQDTDNLFHGKFDSSDLYARIQRNNTYRCVTTGWRLPFLSQYKNLITCQHIAG